MLHGVGLMGYMVSCMLCAGCGIQYNICCMLYVVWMYYSAGYTLYVVPCKFDAVLLCVFVVACCMLHVVSRTLSVVGYMMCVVYCKCQAVCGMHFTCQWSVVCCLFVCCTLYDVWCRWYVVSCMHNAVVWVWEVGLWMVYHI